MVDKMFNGVIILSMDVSSDICTATRVTRFDLFRRDGTKRGGAEGRGGDETIIFNIL